MRKLFFNLIFLFSFAVSFSQQTVPVFVSGSDGYKSFRIPAIISLPDGDLLAFCEGRVNGPADFGNVDIVMKRSIDKGKTWSNLHVIVDADSLQAGNSAPVVDMNDPQFPKGRIFLFYNTGNVNESEIRKGKGVREVWYKTSTDNGNTWSDAVNITTQVHRPNHPQNNPAYNFSEDWRSFANTPGHAMQFQNGKYRGRIFVAANHSEGKPLPHYADGRAFGYYTDDHGKTFQISEDVNVQGGNEATAAELSNGKLMLNARNQLSNIKARIVAISSNGGQTWDTTYFDMHLPDPVCEGSILTVGKKHRKNILAFCNAADTLNRNNLTLRISYDDGKTWKKKFLIDKADSKKDYTAYSDIVKISKNLIGILYEKDNYNEIVFTTVKWK